MSWVLGARGKEGEESCRRSSSPTPRLQPRPIRTRMGAQGSKPDSEETAPGETTFYAQRDAPVQVSPSSLPPPSAASPDLDALLAGPGLTRVGLHSSLKASSPTSLPPASLPLPLPLPLPPPGKKPSTRTSSPASTLSSRAYASRRRPFARRLSGHSRRRTWIGSGEPRERRRASVTA